VEAKKFNKIHLAQLQSGKNPAFQLLVDNIMSIQKAHTSLKMDPLPLSYFVKKIREGLFFVLGVCDHDGLLALHPLVYLSGTGRSVR
jgi:hypothetical protein